MKLKGSEAVAFREDGVVWLRNVIDRSWLDLLAEGVERARAAPGALAKDYAKDGRGSFFTDHRLYQRFEPFRRFEFEGPASEIAAQILGAKRLHLYDEHLLIKEPGTDTPTFWHQDSPYLNIQGEQSCTMWLPLDPVTEETGALRFAQGSHLWGKLYLPIKIGAGESDPASATDPDIFGPVPDIDANPQSYKTVCRSMEPGDCVIFHGRILHSARGNSSRSQRRRALSLRFCGEDVTWKNRNNAANIFPTPLRDGDPIDREEIPVVWPRRAEMVSWR